MRHPGGDNISSRMSRYSLKKLRGQTVTAEGVRWLVRDGEAATYPVLISPDAWKHVFGSDCSLDTLLFASAAGTKQILATVATVIDAGFPVAGQAILIEVEDIS